MSTTPNLGLAYLTAGQLQPEVTINQDLNILDAAVALSIAFTNNPATTAGLTYGYHGGFLWSGTTESAVAAGTVTLTASTTNYVQLTTAGVISSNTTGFTSGQIPLATVVTGSSAITTITDNRPLIVSGGGASVPVLPVNPQTGTTYTLVLTDAPAANGYQGIVTMNNAAANVLTVPPNSSVAFPVGTQVQVAQLGTGQTSIAAGAGVTVNNPSSLTARARYSTLVLTQVAANVWVLGGDMT